MKTDVILVSNDGNQMEAALNQTGKVAAYKKLSSRNELQLRLLAEEMLGRPLSPRQGAGSGKA